MFTQQLELKMKELPISFTQEKTVHLLEHNFVYPDKIVKATNIHKTLHSNRFKRTSTTLIKEQGSTNTNRSLTNNTSSNKASIWNVV